MSRLSRQLARGGGAFGSLGLALVLATAASAAPVRTCTLQIDSTSGVSSRQVTAGQCVTPSVRFGIRGIALGNGSAQGSLTVFRFANCAGSVIRQGQTPIFFTPPATIGSVRIDSCP
ncbi:hypothetical protein [Streptomyces sp. NRRL F-4489]|uniref:hypothetical protein n=1 Tax=Streptomyces sp. NRRL F-4489 TaxID=1609095 RepID=UPI00131D839A|nr:hypothetical protein [Streptomyces sp. NRRL F-4489]